MKPSFLVQNTKSAFARVLKHLVLLFVARVFCLSHDLFLGRHGIFTREV